MTYLHKMFSARNRLSIVKRPGALCALLLIGAVTGTIFTASPASAFTILGRVVNGTTGAPLEQATIAVVNPRGGMTVEKEVSTIDDLGHFRVEGLDAGAPVYLLRVTHAGVNYTEMIQPDGEDPHTVEIKVYETTTSWERIHVSIPHLVVARSADTLNVQTFFSINNHTNPPLTLTGDDSRFKFDLPNNRLNVEAFYVLSMGIPIELDPEPTGEEGVYSVDYPIKPGTTQMMLSVNVPYNGGRGDYRQILKHDMREIVVMLSDPTMQVARGGVALDADETSHGYTTFRLSDLEAGSELALSFSGGSETARGMPQVRLAPNETNDISIALLIALAMALVGLLAFAAKRPAEITAASTVLDEHRNALLSQLARLDDLYQTGTIPEAVYRLKRTELMNSLAQIYYRDRVEPHEATAEAERKEEGAARV